MKRYLTYIFCTTIALLVSFSSCREDELVMPTEYEILPKRDVIAKDDSVLLGMYLLNEGNMGSNKASIDFVDFRNNLYTRSLYTDRNPNVIKELGDVGNDIQIYGNRIYAVINCSHKVEVLDATTCRRIGQIDIPNCRYIKFDRGYAYVSSYVGPVAIDKDAQLGAIFKVDTATMQIVNKVSVGYQPDELEILGEYIYVANSGGYRGAADGGEYDNTVSVVEMYSMKQIQKIPVAINLHRIRKDKYNKLWVTSRGNYKNIPSKMFVLERKSANSNEMIVTDSLNVPCSQLVIQGDSIFFCSAQWQTQSETNKVTYGIIDVKTKKQISDSFITDGTEANITVPYGINIDPKNGDIYVTDAKNYVSSGSLHCYSRTGKRRWSVRTGDIPAHMVFLYNMPNNKK